MEGQDKKVTITKKQREELKKSAREAAMKEYDLKPEDVAIIEAALKEAKMPVSLLDKDFKLGPGELDIRKLCDKNLDQMMFRLGILDIVYLRQISTSFIDIIRLLMLILKKLGYDDIVKATDDLLQELEHQEQERAKRKFAKKPEEKPEMN